MPVHEKTKEKKKATFNGQRHGDGVTTKEPLEEDPVKEKQGTWREKGDQASSKIPLRKRRKKPGEKWDDTNSLWVLPY